MIFSYSNVKNAGNTWFDTIKILRDTPQTKIENTGGRLYGIWTPHFGLPSNELIIMFVWHDDQDNKTTDIAQSFLSNLDGIVDVNTRQYKPTVRPMDDKSPDKKGMYVHRWMTFNTADLEEAVALSKEAWVTFEKSFDAKVIGLFQDTNEQNGFTSLMLISWYRDFKAWQDSRNADKEPKSWDNFLKRHRMTRDSLGIATELWILK